MKQWIACFKIITNKIKLMFKIIMELKYSLEQESKNNKKVVVDLYVNI